ncbi:MAG: SGNH/GDSL hydrolase family protein [Bacteroidota bacterium]
MITNKFRRMFVAGIFLFMTLVSGSVAAGQYQRLVVFGDSLSDPGNAFALIQRVSVPPFELIPDAPYARGGLHFSNGSTWVEQLATDLHLGMSAGPVLRAPGVFSNYAVGAARARPGALDDLGSQVVSFLGDFGGAAPPDALYVVFIGSNDLRDALVALSMDPSGNTSFAYLNAALGAINDNLTTLASAGARQFLVANAPDIGLTPAVRAQGPAAQAAALALVTAFNNGLEAIVSGLETNAPVHIARFDVYGILNQVVADPAAAGLTDAVDSCITPDTRAGAFCAQPDTYLFWDGIHPTRAGHTILAHRAEAVLAQ